MTDAARPLPLRMRPDLLVSRERFGGRAYLIVKDPLALRHFRFEEEEFAQLELLDGRRTLEQLRTELERRFAPQQFPVEQIARFAGSLHQSALVVSDARGQGPALWERATKQRGRGFWRQLASPLSIRIRGFDPTRLLDALSPLVRWCYSKTALVAAGLLMMLALGLVAVHYDEMHRRLPTFQQFFTPSNLLLLLALTGAIKIIHELGHGLTCRHFGGECHELGLMFLVLAPCLYCNVSDAWRLPKWQRIAVSSAGILIEFVLASLAVFGWWFSAPGVWNQLCLGAVFVSGVSTLLINGNPLLRYDGYFILSDLVETPNLAEKATAVLRRAARRLWFGEDREPDLLVPTRHRGWFALYAVASFVYRCLLVGTIFFFLLEWARPYRLENVARTMGIISVGGLVGGLLMRLRNVGLELPGRSARQQRRFGLCTTVLSLTAAAILLIPWPQRVWGTLELEPHAARQIYVDVPGRLKSVAVRPGEVVRPGVILATLENLDLEREIAELRGRAAVARTELATLRVERFQSTAAAERISEALETLQGAEDSLREKLAQERRLTLTAGEAGIVLPPAETPAPKVQVLGELPQWHGLPADQKNLGALFTEGTLFCRIGDGKTWEAVTAVDQSDIELLQEGQVIDVKVDAVPQAIFTGEIAEISQRELLESPTRLSNKAGGDLATQTDESGVERPISSTYQVRIVLRDDSGLLRTGLRGTARIHVPSASLASRSWRWFSRTFHFEL